jgi:molecular chaperone HscB
MNYFELFDLPMSFEIDVDLLNKKYIALQKQFHPDYFTQADETEQQDVLEKSSLLCI